MLALMLALGVCLPVGAQVAERPFADLGRHLHPGDTIFVVGHETGEMRGRLVGVSPTSLVVTVDGQDRQILATEIGWIEKRGDRLWEGALIGAGTLALGFAAGAGSSCSPDCGEVVKGAALGGAAIGAAIGAGIDWLHPGRTLVYGTPPGSPNSSQAQRLPNSLGTLWSRVRPGDPISVREKGGEETVGIFSRASESSLTMVVDRQPREIPAGEVQQVIRRRGGNQLRRYLLIGAAIGAFGGSSGCYSVETPAYAAGSGPSCGASILKGVALGGMVGAALGSIVWGRTLVYDRPPDSANASRAQASVEASKSRTRVTGAPVFRVSPTLGSARTGLMLSVQY